MSDEKTFLNEKGIIVSNARFVVNGRTYPMSAINSVKLTTKNPDITGPIVLAVIGISAFWFAAHWWYSFILIAVAVGWWFLLRKKHTIELELSSGPQDVYTSHNKSLVDKTVQALNDAIIHRENNL